MYTQPIELDANGDAIVSAFKQVQSFLADIQKQVAGIGVTSKTDVEKWSQQLSENLKMLKQARSDLRELQTDKVDRTKGFKDAEKAARDLATADARANSEANRQKLIEAKVYYSERESAARGTANVEKQLAKEVADFEKSQDRAAITSAKEVAAARREAAQAAVTAKARGITNPDDARAAKAASDLRLSQLRREREAAASNDVEASRAIADRITIEKALGRELDNTIKKLNAQTEAERRAQEAATARLTGQNTASQKLLAPQTTRTSADQFGAQSALAGYKFEQENASRALSTIIANPAATAEQVAAARQRLEITNANVAAAERLVRADEADAAAVHAQNNKDRLEQQKAQIALSSQYARDQIAALGPAEAMVRAKEATAIAEQRLRTAIGGETVELREQLALAQKRQQETEKAAADQARSNRQSIGGRVSTALQNTALYGAVAGVGYAAFGEVQQTISNIVQLEDEFAKLQAIGNATDGEMQHLKASIYDIGDNSRFAVNDLVKISQTLAQAGISASQMGDVLKSVTTLATASGSSPDEAVQLVTSALGAFQLQATEAGRVADLMTSALNRTKLTVTQVGQAIQYVGATAYEQNISLETLLATVGAVAQGGVKSGSTIGTGFRQFLVDLQTPTAKLKFELDRLGITQDQVNVKTHGLAGVLELLKSKGFGATQAYDGLETRAAAFYLVAKNNVDVMDQLQLSFALQGAAAVANERAMNSLTSQWQRFKNVIQEGFSESMEGTMGTLQNVLRLLSDRIIAMRGETAKLKELGTGNVDKQSSVTPGGVDLGRAGQYLNAGLNYDLTSHLSLGLEGLVNLGGNIVSRFGNANQTLAQTFSISDGLGSRFAHLGDTASSTSASIEKYADALSAANDKVQEHSDRITEVDHEMGSLKARQSELINNQIRSQAETVSLTARFGGLVKFLGTTKNAYLDLINAMGEYRGEESRFLAEAYEGQASVQGKQNLEDRTNLDKTVSRIKGSSEFSQLKPYQQKALDDPTNINFPAAMRQAADALAKSGDKFASVLYDAATYSARLSGGQRAKIAEEKLAGSSRAAGTQLGIQIANETDTATTRLGALSTMPEDQRTKAGNALTGDLNRFIAKLTPKLAVTSGANKEFVQSAITNLKGLLDQVAAAIKPSQEEIKAAKEKAADARRAEADASRRPKVTQSAIDKVGDDLGLKRGRGHDESAAARAEEDRLHALGLTRATGMTSGHTAPGGLARDFSVAGMSEAEARRTAATMDAQYKQQGIDALVQYETGKGKNQGTGRHIHVSVRPGTRMSKDKTETSASQYDADLSQSQTALDETALADRVKEIGKQTSTDAFNAAVASAHNALDKLNKDLLEAAKDELASKGIGEHSVQGEAKITQVNQQIAQNISEFQGKVADAIVKSVDKQTKAAQAAFDAAVTPALRVQQIAQGQASGLDAYSLRNKVPDYTRQLAANRVAASAEGVDRATYAALPAQIASTQASLDTEQGKLAGLTDPAAIATVSTSIADLSQKLKDLTTSRDALAEKLSAGGLVPTSLGEGLSQAIEAFRQAHDMSNTFAQELTKNLGGALDTVNDGLTTMFSSILDGSSSALGAFGNFAKGIMQFMVQIAAKALATQVIGLLLNLAGSAFGSKMGTASTADKVSFINANPGAAFTGGTLGDDNMIHRATGGSVENGDPSRDSVHTKLARGEWVVQKSSVDSVGNQFMARLNQHGSKALDGLQAMPKLDMKSHTETNVYVVPGPQQPKLGPNDVRVILTDELMNGDGKRLVEHIARDR